MAFTLTMLGTDTLFTPGPKPGDYPRGETLSVVATLIAGDAQTDNNAVSPFVSDKVAVVNGPNTMGSNVGHGVWCGVLAILNAIARGETTINIAAHSRGAVESILIAHEINNIQQKYLDAQQNNQPTDTILVNVINELAEQEKQAAKISKKYNTGEVMRHLAIAEKNTLTQLSPQVAAAMADVHLNLFLIDPVPGDAPGIYWNDERYYQIPDIVRDCKVILYENERSNYFSAVLPKPSPKEGATFDVMPMPGNHGTGSAGNNCDQGLERVPAEKGKATHVQQLVFFKLLAFLNEHEVEFNDPASWPSYDNNKQALLNKVRKLLNSLDSTLTSNRDELGKLYLPTCFRLYRKIWENITAYQHFNSTNYKWLGRASEKHRFLLVNGQYQAFTEHFRPSNAFVNDEHAKIAEQILFTLLGITKVGAKPLELHEVVTTAIEALLFGIAVIKDGLSISGLDLELENPLVPLLKSQSGRTQVADGFRVLVDKISQTYLRNHLTTEAKENLLAAVQLTFVRLSAEQESLQEEKPELAQFITEILDGIKVGLAQTVISQYDSLKKDAEALLNPPAAASKEQLIEQMKQSFYTLIYGSFPPEILQNRSNEVTEWLAGVLASACNDLQLPITDDKITRVWNALKTAILTHQDNFWSAETKAQLDAFDETSALAAIHEQINRANAPATLADFKDVGSRLDYFRTGLAVFKQFELNIPFDEQERQLGILQRLVVDKAVDVKAAQSIANTVDWDHFEAYLDRMAIANGALDPEKIALNCEKDLLAATLQTRQETIAAKESELLGLQTEAHAKDVQLQQQAELISTLTTTNSEQQNALEEKIAEKAALLAAVDRLTTENAAKDFDLAARKQQLETSLREKDEALLALQEQLATAKQAETALKQQMADLEKAVNCPRESEYLRVLEKLLPLTDGYLTHLQSLPADSNTLAKLNAVSELKACLTDCQAHVLPSKRLEAFCIMLGAKHELIKSHRDEQWKRYLKNTALVAGIVLTGIVPGLAILAIVAAIAPRQSSLFWRSQGENVVNEATSELASLGMKAGG